MKIINLAKLNEFGTQHADARKSLATWQDTTEKAIWKKKQDILDSFPAAKMLRNDRARFEIKHNTYRLVAYVGYEAQTVVIRFIGTHTQYDRIDPETV